MLFIRQGVMMHREDWCHITYYEDNNSEGHHGTWEDLLSEAHKAAHNMRDDPEKGLCIVYIPPCENDDDQYEIAVASTWKSEVEN